MKLDDVLDDIIEESFNRPLDWEYKGRIGSGYKYMFVSKNILYEVYFVTLSPFEFEGSINLVGALEDDITRENTFRVDYMAIKNTKTNVRIPFGFSILESGNSIEVHSTVLDIIKDARKRINIKFAIFSSGETSRNKLYQRMIKKLVNGRIFIQDGVYLVEL